VGTALAGLVLGTGTFVLAQGPQAPSPPVGPVCTVGGQVASGGTSLPGVSLRATRDGMVAAATSTDVNGAYSLRLAPGSYQVSAELAAFARFEQALTVSGESCPPALDVALQLVSRAPSAETASAAAPPAAPESPEQPPAPFGGRGRRGGGPGDLAARARARFAQLDVVQADTASAAADDSGLEIDFDDPAARLLPPGFSTDVSTDVVAVLGDAARVDRGQLRDRLDALGRGEFAAIAGQLPPGIDLAQAIERFAGGGFGGGRGGGGFEGFGGRGGRGGFDGGGFLGRGRAGNAYSGSATYTFGGSILDAAPARIRASSQSDPDYARQNFGASLGGPLRLPGVPEARRPNIFFNYSGGRSTDLVDRYATVPTLEMRAGDFSGVGVNPVDPLTGLPFAGSQIPGDRIDPGSQQLLGYIPEPNLPGTAQNYRRSTTSATTSDGFSVRVTQTLGAAGRGRGGRGGRGGGGGGGQGRGGRAGGATGLAASMNAQVQYQRSDSDALNVFPGLDGANHRTSLSVPVTVNLMHARTVHNVQINTSRTSSSARNAFANVLDVAGLAGIGGVASDPADWGVPTLSFSSLTGLRDLTPTRRSDNRFSVSYSMTRPAQRHNFQWGGDARFDTSRGRSNGDARGTFVFTGLYAAGGPVVGGQGLDFADFLLGAPQQATVQYAEDVVLQGRSFSLYAQDDWRFRGNLTLNLGVRYELVRPFTEASGRMVNLDVAPDFSGAAPVLSGGTGTFSGLFPGALINEDYNNVAPRVGLAWRTAGMVVRTGFGTSFNNGSYSAIARQLTGQPPFAVTNTSIGTAFAPLTYGDPFASVEENTTTNNFGVDRGYQLGVINTWNVDVDRGLPGGWQVGVGYTGTQGQHLDLVRAPNRGPDGLRIEDVQPFLWQTSDGRSILHSGTVRLRRRQAAGVSGNLSYTLARSMDDASSLGGGGQQVAQDDQNLAAEWGLSSFDRRHQFNGSLTLELPFGENRPWLYRGGVWAGLLSDWSLSASYSAQSGTPLTARVVGAASDVARGTNGSLRADYTGAPVSIGDPTLLQYFNTTAFAVPIPGTFGSSGRNTIIGPAQQQLDATLSRDLRLGAQGVSIQLRANNVLNSVYFGAIDTTVNSPTFGQVVSFRPRRSVQLNLRFRY
jgi:hypothetical protein